MQINTPRYGNTQVVAETFEELRSLSSRRIETGYSAIVSGASSPADGFGGMLVWLASSRSPDNNETIIAPSDGGQGRWHKIAVGQTGEQGDVGPPGARGPQGVAGQNILAIPSKDAADGLNVPTSTNRVQTASYSATGTTGSAQYVYDPAVTADYHASHPRATFIAEDGRGFRLSEVSVTPEMFGAIGDGVTNDQPAWQAAFDYCAVSGIQTLNCPAARYAVWSTVRTTPVQAKSGGAGNNHTFDGEALVLRCPLSIASLYPTGTTIIRRNVDGRSFAINGAWQVVAGADAQVDGPKCMFRGAGIMVVGLTKEQLDAGVPLNSLTLTDITIDSELPWSAALEPDKNTIDPATGQVGDHQGAYPARLTGPFIGLGWDCLNRGIYFEEDRFCGGLTMIRSTITRFRGEMVRQGYGGFIVADSSTFSICGADLINPSGAYTILTNCNFSTAFAGWEGWFGAGGRLNKCVFKDCIQGAARLQGGTYNGGGSDQINLPGGYYIATRMTPNEVPYADIDATFINCGTVLVGSWIRGTIRTTDTIVSIYSYNQHDVVQDVDLTIYATIDQNSGTNGFTPLTFYDQDQVAGSKVFRNIRFTVYASSSQAALAANPPRHFEVPVSYIGSVGERVVVENGSAVTTRLASANGATPDNKILFRGNSFQTVALDYTSNYADLSVNGTIEPKGDHYLVYVGGATSSSVTPMKIATSGYQHGAEVRIMHDPNAPQGSMVTLVGDGSAGMLLLDKTRTLTHGQEILLRFNIYSNTWTEAGYFPYGGITAVPASTSSTA